MKQFTHDAWISWLPQQKGGRTHVPTSQYRIGVHVDGQKNWPAEGWTLVVKPTRLFRGNRIQSAKIAFLVEEGPSELLSAGVRFELLDGLKVVAHGLVVDARNSSKISRAAVERVLLV